MTALLPEAARVALGADHAEALAERVARLGGFDDASLRDPARQDELRRQLRDALPERFDALVRKVRRRLSRAPYVAVLSGLPLEGADLLLVGLTSAFGRVVEPYGREDTRVVFRVTPRKALSVGSWGALNELLHTDGTDWPEPNDLTCLYCLAPDQRGQGRSRLLDADRVQACLDEGSPRLARILEESPLPWKLADELGGGVVWAPALRRRRLRWLRYTTAISLEVPGVSVTDAMLEALEEFERLVEDSPQVVEFSLEAGDLLIANNARCLHARTPIERPEESERELLRTKVKRVASAGPTPDGWRY